MGRALFYCVGDGQQDLVSTETSQLTAAAENSATEFQGSVFGLSSSLIVSSLRFGILERVKHTESRSTSDIGSGAGRNHGPCNSSHREVYRSYPEHQILILIKMEINTHIDFTFISNWAFEVNMGILIEINRLSI